MGEHRGDYRTPVGYLKEQAEKVSSLQQRANRRPPARAIRLPLAGDQFTPTAGGSPVALAWGDPLLGTLEIDPAHRDQIRLPIAGVWQVVAKARFVDLTSAGNFAYLKISMNGVEDGRSEGLSGTSAAGSYPRLDDLVQVEEPGVDVLQVRGFASEATRKILAINTLLIAHYIGRLN